MDGVISEPVRVIRDDEETLAAAAALAAQFRLGAAERDRERMLPSAEIEELTRAGFFGVTVPRRYGGAEVTAVTVAESFRTLAAADASIGQIPQNHFCWLPVISNGSEAQASFLYRRILAGDRIGNAHSEDTLRRPGDYEHKLERVEGGYRLTGRKFYSTGAFFAQWIPFIGAIDTGAGAEPHMFFAAADAEGLSVIDDWDGMGQRTTASGTTLFEAVFVSDTLVFPLRAKSDVGRSFALNANLIHAAIDVGIAQEALSDAARYIRSNNRPWLGNPFDEHAREPFVVRDFGRLSLLARTAHLSLKHAASLIDAARAAPTPESLIAARLAIADARIVASDAATRIADEFFLLTGGRATMAKHALDRHWRNARTHSLHDPLRWKEYHVGNYHLNGVVPEPGNYI